MSHLQHPSLFEINTRVLLNSPGHGNTISEIPLSYWKDLRAKGIDWVWLMGIWELREKAIDPFLIPDSMQEEFRLLLHDLTDDDICGSPYAIHDYVIDPDIGTRNDLISLRKTLHKLGMKLMLDFVPNHFGAHTKWLNVNPAYFIEVDESRFVRDQKTFYRPWHDRNHFFAHGKDPYFDAWQDTVQVNYLNPETQQWMTGILQSIAEVCDGVRCDMAMLATDRIFTRTWGDIADVPEVRPEFWPAAISAVKKQHPEFCFLAECYWDMEAELLAMGFDYCYDKIFFDRIAITDTDRMRLHFHAEEWWLMKTARFLENHDEHRAASRMTFEQHAAAAALIAFGPGLRFWHMGQWEGKRRKVPVQLKRSPVEPAGDAQSSPGETTAISGFYAHLLSVNQQELFRQGDWRVLHEISAMPGLICWYWRNGTEQVIIVINFSNVEVQFLLTDQLQLLKVKDPADIIGGDVRVDPDHIRALVPWAICAWRVTDA